MQPIEWFNNLKWIRAIRDYDILINAMNDGLRVIESNKKLISTNTRLILECAKLKEENDQIRRVFAIHRRAAETSIEDASQARLEYEDKAKRLESGDNRRLNE
jgi:hypothetical protein